MALNGLLLFRATYVGSIMMWLQVLNQWQASTYHHTVQSCIVNLL